VKEASTRGAPLVRALRAVCQVLVDYQGNTSASAGGDGWLRFITFDLEAGTTRFRTYSPTLDKSAGQMGEHTFNQPPLFSDFTLPVPPQVTQSSRRPMR
jgi:hypothetical protein